MEKEMIKKLNIEEEHQNGHVHQHPLLEVLKPYSLSPSTPLSLSSSLVYTPKHPSFSTILNSHIRNLRFVAPTTPKPLLIITPSEAAHVQGAVTWAKKARLQIRVRSGGHDYEGLSYRVSSVGPTTSNSTPAFLLLDMFNLKSIEIDLQEETAWVQAGATLGELLHSIASRSGAHGFPAGVCPSVGVGGHFSGGGYGNMMRKFGLTTDNVVDAEIVDANGRVMRREEMGEDLFWALRGGGGASFGVIIAYKIKLVRVPEKVTVFRVSRTIEENAIDAVLQWQEIASTVDNDLFIRLCMDVVDPGTSGEKTVKSTFISLFLGNTERVLSLMNKHFPKLGLQRSDCHEMSWIESVIFWAEFPMGTPLEVLLERAPPKLTHLTRKSDYVKDPIPQSGFEFIWKKLIECGPQIGLKLNPYGGRMSEISEDATAFPHRRGNLFKIQYLANWDEDGKEMEKHYLGLIRKIYECMTPFVSKFPRQAYFNYRDLDLGVNHHEEKKRSYMEGSKYGVHYFMNNFDKLVEVKTKIDPDNFFKNEQSIPIMYGYKGQ